MSRGIRLLAASLIMICTGIVYMWSVFGQYVPNAAFTSSVMITCFSFGALIGGRIQDKIGPRLVAIIGSVGFFLGVFLTSFTMDMGPVWIYLTFGVLGGFSVGCTYNSAIPCIQKWFPDKLNVCMGIIVMAFGLSTVIFAPVARALAAAAGIKATFQILAVVFLVVCLVSSFALKNPSPGWLPEGYGPKKNASNISQRQYQFSQAIKTRQMWILFITIWFVTVAFFSINPVLLQLGIKRGLSDVMATGLVMACGLGLAVGRLVMPLVADVLHSRHKTTILVTAVTLVCSIALIWASGSVFLVLVFLLAVFSGSLGAIFPGWTVENFGLENNGANYGFIMLGIGLSSLLSYRVANALAASFGGVTGGIAVNDSLYFVIAIILSAIALIGLLTFKNINTVAKDK